ncbi:hypothetical protein ACH4OY_07455 [Micromonospora rubida]|uniref:Uncharacterized protein n=1 Tax=Micromonospora rubida TaxID=2697657 RepID=A0ABW7SHZ6_9ACTN
MDKVEMLCLGAEALLDQYQYDQRALELLDRAQELLEEAGEDTAAVDELLDCALELEEEARAAAGEAERTLGLAASGLRDAAGVLDLAEEAAMQVKAALKAEEPSAEVRGLKERVRQVRIKITSLRSRLTEK